jgi:transposase
MGELQLSELTEERLWQFGKAELIQILLLLLGQNERLKQEITVLKERLNQNSGNSSKPPSTDGYNKPNPQSSRKKSGKKAGGQFGHPGQGKKPPGHIDERRQVRVQACPHCGKEMAGEKGKLTETRYVQELPEITVKTIAYDQYETKCPHCGKASRGVFPENVTGKFQYGAHMKALLVVLVEYGMIGMGRVRDIEEWVFGIGVSCGTIAGAVKGCAGGLKKAWEQIKEAVKGAEVVHFDETGMRNRGEMTWLHTASTDWFTYLQIHQRRGREAMEGIGILPGFEGTAVHDCWESYWGYPCRHALCNAHLLRELMGVKENTGQEWAEEMIWLLIRVKGSVERYREAGKEALSGYLNNRYSTEYDEIVREGLEENPPAQKEGNRRGRTKQSKARLLLERLKKHKQEYMRFSRDFRVPFDNNQAERDFRISKVKQKVSGGFRSEGGGESFAIIQSVIQTLHKHRIGIFNELVKAFNPAYSLPLCLNTTE